MDVQTDRAFLPASEAATRYLIATITAPKSGRVSERPALNVALVLDRSGSMGGSKLRLAKQAVGQAIAVLDERDRLAVVCYDNEVDTILGSTKAGAEAKALANSRLSQIDARGNTNLSGGWERGVEQVSLDDSGSALRRVLLLSDGLANEGETNPDVLAARAALLRAQGVATSTFGLGADFDEVLMSRLATEGGGHFYFIEHPAQIPDILTSELGESLDVVSRDARLIVQGGAGVSVVPMTGHRVEAQGEELHVRLGDLVSEQQVTVVVALHWLPRPIGVPAIVALRLTDRDGVLFPQPLPVEFEVVDAARNRAQPVNVAVLVAAAQQMAAMARERATQANRQGDYRAAGGILAEAARDIRALAPGTPELEVIVHELGEQAHEFSAAMSAMELKRAHFATHSERLSRDETGKARRRKAVVRS